MVAKKTVSGLAVGTYNIELKDRLTQCKVNQAFSITSGNKINIDVTATGTATCSASADGQVTFVATGASSASFNYTIEDAQGGQLTSGVGTYGAGISFSSLPVGTHTIGLDDVTLGCQFYPGLYHNRWPADRHPGQCYQANKLLGIQ